MFEEILIKHQNLTLEGHVSYEENSKGWVIFAHGSGSSRKSSRNNWVAKELNKYGYSTLLFDLLTEREDMVYENRFNIPLLALRLILTTRWLINSDIYKGQPIAYFGASTGAAAALIAAGQASNEWPLFTVISRGGRPDLAGKENLHKVYVPVLLVVGDRDTEVIRLNREAGEELTNSQLTLIPGASHLFEEEGALDKVVIHAKKWLDSHLPRSENVSL